MSWGCQKVMVEILEVVKNPKNSAIFAKKCLKRLKVISREWLTVQSWEIPHFNRNMHVYINVSYNVYLSDQ